MVTLAWLRDLVIVVFAGVGTIAAILVIVIASKTYFRLKPTLNSAKDASANIKATSALISEIQVRPIIQVSSLAKGMRQAIATISRLTRRKGGGKNG